VTFCANTTCARTGPPVCFSQSHRINPCWRYEIAFRDTEVVARKCDFRSWHKCEVPTVSGNVRCSGQSGRDGQEVKTARLTHLGNGSFPLLRLLFTSLQGQNLNAKEIGWPFRLGLEGCIVDRSQPEMLQRRGADDNAIIALGV
jgi:hypothetical protein